MLRVNVGLSRKLSKDYNSTGFSINLDGEVTAPSSDAEAVIEQVKELFDLAEETLNRQIERHESDSAIASRDEEPAVTNGRQNGYPRNGTRPNGEPTRTQTATNGSNGKGDDAATDKQINYLLSIGKRSRLTTAQLEQRIEEVLGAAVGLYDLTKKDAAKVIDELTQGATNGHATSRR